MTNEEMEQRWPIIPPFKCSDIVLNNGNKWKKEVEVNQDTIDDIIEYFEAVRECMNS